MTANRPERHRQGRELSLMSSWIFIRVALSRVLDLNSVGTEATDAVGRARQIVELRDRYPEAGASLGAAHAAERAETALSPYMPAGRGDPAGAAARGGAQEYMGSWSPDALPDGPAERARPPPTPPPSGWRVDPAPDGRGAPPQQKPPF